MKILNWHAITSPHLIGTKIDSFPASHHAIEVWCDVEAFAG